MNPVRDLLSLVLCAFLGAALFAAPPGEVQNLQFSDAQTFSWDSTASAQDYNVYRGRVADLRAGRPPRCHADELTATSHVSPAEPGPGEVFVYLLSAESASDEEGTLGTDSNSVERSSFGRCDPVVFSHVLGRLGFGWGEWSRDRLEQLGYVGFRDEQLDPQTVNENGNPRHPSLRDRWDPPINEAELQYKLMDESLYSYRQLEYQMTEFWINHFNTEYAKTFNNLPGNAEERNLQAAALHLRETDDFRDLAFYGDFRQILEASALSPAMVYYLDTSINTKNGPNENHARELLELHSMGVDNGYTEQDIQELSRVFTGWNVCKKAAADIDDPLAPCILASQAGEWTANFRPTFHDSGQKILFAGTPYETIIPDTSGNTIDGVDDIQLAVHFYEAAAAVGYRGADRRDDPGGRQRLDDPQRRQPRGVAGGSRSGERAQPGLRRPEVEDAVGAVLDRDARDPHADTAVHDPVPAQFLLPDGATAVPQPDSHRLLRVRR
jgi:hypothetical protein